MDDEDFKRSSENTTKPQETKEEPTLGQMTKHYLSLSIPAILNAILSMLVSQMNIVFVGRMGSAPLLAGVGLGSVTLNCLLISLLIGLNGAQDTLVSQAFGIRELELCGRYLNRGVVILMVCFTPLMIVLFFSESILLAIGQEEESSKIAQKYILWMLPCYFFHGINDLFKRFLNCCNVAFVPMVATLITTVLHILWLWVFVTVADLEIIGIAIASFVTAFSQTIVCIIYANQLPQMKGALQMPTCDVFEGWGKYFKLGIPSILMLIPEWWAFEFLTIMAGWIGVDEQAVMVVVFNLIALFFMVPMGFQEGACTVIGNEIGANNPIQARKYLKLTAGIAIPTSFVLIFLLYIGRHLIASIYFVGDDENTLALSSMLADAIKLICLLCMADHFQGYIQGPLRGLGLQLSAAIFCIVAFYVFSIPCAAIFTFVLKLGISGLQYGILVGAGVQAFFYFYLVVSADWEKIAQKAHEDHLKEAAEKDTDFKKSEN